MQSNEIQVYNEYSTFIRKMESRVTPAENTYNPKILKTNLKINSAT